MFGSRLASSLALGLAFAFAVAGCSSDTTTSTEGTGSLSLSLEVDGVAINSVNWVITAEGMGPMDGTINTSAPGSTASVEVFGLPAGDYNIALSAMGTDEQTECKGSEDFSVQVGEVTEIMVVLRCKRPTRFGGVRVNGKFNICAELTKMVVSPLQTSVGNDIDLKANAEDAENDPIAYVWTATGGSIADPTAKETTYTCEEVGNHAVTVMVTDQAEYCEDGWTVDVRCELPDLEWPPDATAYFDQYGILNADCATDEDCAMVLGYHHAFDRFVQMDFRRRFATGRLTDIFDKTLAQLLGVPELAAETRALFSTRDGRPLEEVALERASVKTLAMLKAYSAGVNQWIDDVRNGRNGAVFPRELANFPFTYGPANIPEWTPSDSAATVMALIDRSTNKEAVEVNAGAAREAIANDVKFSDLWSLRPFVESSILPPGWMPLGSSSKRAAAIQQQLPRRDALNAGPALQRLSNHLERTKELRHMPFGSVPGGGSNNWAIAPSRSVTGNALLASDPHQPMTQPAAQYLVHVDAKTNGSGQIHSAGATLAGTPWVAVGQNEKIAWGETDTFFDMTDVYIEELVKDTDGSAMGVMFEGEFVPFTRVAFTVTFNDGSTEERELLFVPHHGPVREIDVDNDVAITLRWTAQDTTTDIEFITALNTAESVMEARSALENATTLGWNFVVADAEGNIGWFPYSRLPKRSWATNLSGAAPPWLPLDGRCETPERCYEWTEYFELAELPQALNPSEGFIATANNDMTGALFDGDPTNDGYPPFQTNVEPGIRHARIVKLIEEIGSEHTTATMQRIQSDVYSLAGELMRPGFIAIAESDMTTLSERAQKIVDAFKDWNFTCPTGLGGPYNDSPLTDDPDELREARGCAAFHAAQYLCWFPLLLGERGRVEPNLAYFYSFVDPSQLQAGDVYWDDPRTPEIETKYQGIAGCLDAAGRNLAEVVGLGDDETQWVWGRVLSMVLRSDLSAFGISNYDNPPPGEPRFANDGGYRTVDVATPSFSLDWVQQQGASTRLVCEALPSGPACTIQLPGGQSGDINSPNYEDLLFKYLDNEPIDLVFDIDEAKANAVRTVTFE